MREEVGRDRDPAGNLIPDAILDGGDERWDVLSRAISRRLAALQAGQVLEIVTGDAGSADQILAWCATAGVAEVLQAQEDQRGRHVWLRKR